jgi:hypothetical protein
MSGEVLIERMPEFFLKVGYAAEFDKDFIEHQTSALTCRSSLRNYTEPMRPGLVVPSVSEKLRVPWLRLTRTL